MSGDEVSVPPAWLVRKQLTLRDRSMAWSELYLLMSKMFLRYEVEIYKTTAADMAWTDHLLML